MSDSESKNFVNVVLLILQSRVQYEFWYVDVAVVIDLGNVCSIAVWQLQSAVLQPRKRRVHRAQLSARDVDGQHLHV